MNLRKALDKAQLERHGGVIAGGDNSNFDFDIRDNLKQSSASDVGGPVYSQSHKVTCDPQKLLENKCVCMFPQSPELEEYKVLRAQLTPKLKKMGAKTLMVTSPRIRDGKTITAINLALTFAKEFHQTVMLVDCDLKKQDIHNIFGYDSSAGIGDFLLEKCSIHDAIKWPGIEKLTIMSGGKTIEDSAELLGSPQMKKIIMEMKDRYDNRFIIFDVPSLLDGADAITFSQFVDAILIVIDDGKTTIDDVSKSIKLIPEEKIVGFILNRKK